MRVLNWLKKSIALIVTTLAVTVVISPNLAAQGNDAAILQQIANNTYGILQQVNSTTSATLSSVLQALAAYLTSWTTNDQSNFTSQAQGSFTNIGTYIVNDMSTQLGLQPQLLAQQLSPLPPAKPYSAANLTAPPGTPNSILSAIPNVNDLAYSTLLGTPPSPKAPNIKLSPYNYVANASGITLTHIMPSPNWQGTAANQLKYQYYYNTIMAIESFNSYVLSNQYAESQNNNPLTTTQNSLILQATNSNWFTTIASQQLGIVLRQILLFASQTYVLMTQLLQTQKQLLTAQVMTNSLLIATLQNSETLLVSNAQGVAPQP